MLLIKQWLNVDVTVHTGTSHLASVLFRILLLMGITKGLSVMEISAKGVFV